MNSFASTARSVLITAFAVSLPGISFAQYAPPAPQTIPAYYPTAPVYAQAPYPATYPSAPASRPQQPYAYPTQAAPPATYGAPTPAYPAQPVYPNAYPTPTPQPPVGYPNAYAPAPAYPAPLPGYPARAAAPGYPQNQAPAYPQYPASGYPQAAPGYPPAYPDYAAAPYGYPDASVAASAERPRSGFYGRLSLGFGVGAFEGSGGDDSASGSGRAATLSLTGGAFLGDRLAIHGDLLMSAFAVGAGAGITYVLPSDLFISTSGFAFTYEGAEDPGPGASLVFGKQWRNTGAMSFAASISLFAGSWTGGRGDFSFAVGTANVSLIID